jgi:hypothetical protein
MSVAGTPVKGENSVIERAGLAVWVRHAPKLPPVASLPSVFAACCFLVLDLAGGPN